MKKAILAINSGSSSIKYALFAADDLSLLHQSENQEVQKIGHEAALRLFFDWLAKQSFDLMAVGHRVVHGGPLYHQPIWISDDVMRKLHAFIPLAPLHQEHNLKAIEIIHATYPNLPQVACFDTAFHHTQERLARIFAIPRDLTNEGILRYGFHGISYEYIASIITDTIGDKGNQRVIVAHLGNGASMCAMHQRKSVASSMGFTALEGLMMGTRCGHIDPGVLLHLLQEKKYTAKQVEDLLYHRSGLLGVSEKSSNMRELLQSNDPKCIEAVDLFCYRAAQEAGALIVSLKGVDVFVFTAGIGEHAAIVRQKICAYFQCEINEDANQKNALIISEKNSPILVCVIPTNEAYMIAKHTLALLNASAAYA